MPEKPSDSASPSKEFNPEVKPTLPPNVSIFSPKDTTSSTNLLNSHIFSRLTTSPRTEPTQLAALLKNSPEISEAFCLSHGSAVLVFDPERPGVDVVDSHHEHVRLVCLALKDADIGLTISGCIFDATEVVKAGFQLDKLSGGAVMIVDLMLEDEDESDDDLDEDEDPEAVLMGLGGGTGAVLS